MRVARDAPEATVSGLAWRLARVTVGLGVEEAGVGHEAAGSERGFARARSHRS